MISRTKYEIDNETIKKLFKAAGIDGVLEIAPLGSGEYNAVFSAKADGKEYALKIAPKDDVPILTYEKDMMSSEVFWYNQIKEHTSITVPEIYYTDFDKKIIPTNYFIMEKLQGQQLDKADLSKDEKADSVSEMSKMVAQIHKIKNDKFGYVQNELYDDWYQAIRAMSKNILNDCEKKGKKSKNGEKLLTYIDKHKDVLKKAECSMVNFDMCPPNIMCKRENDKIKYAWIDPERSFWGDRIFDFVLLEMMVPFANKKASFSAYNSIADKPVNATDEEKIRYAVALGYLALIMEVEKYFRYTKSNFGWWRNALASALFFKKSFEGLKNE